MEKHQVEKRGYHEVIQLIETKEEKLNVIHIKIENIKELREVVGFDTTSNMLASIENKISGLLPFHAGLFKIEYGDFIIVTDFMEDSELKNIVEKLHDIFNVPFYDNELSFPMYLETKVSVVDHFSDFDKANDTINNIYSANKKVHVRDNIHYYKFDKELSDENLRKFRIKNELKLAIENNELHLNFQPIVNTYNLEVKGIETLLRWKHSSMGFISPAEFIPIAEESGLIVEIGDWVLNEVFKQVEEWTYLGYSNFVVSLNISLIQLQSDGFVDKLKRLLNTYEVPASRIVLEMTESVANESNKGLSNTLLEIQKLGFKIAIDDFGAGYSSLSKIKTFNADILKLDKGFVDDIVHNSISTDIVRMVKSLTDSVGLDMIIEGVETLPQIAKLKEIGCEYIQGYVVSKPVFSNEIVNFLDGKKVEYKGYV